MNIANLATKDRRNCFFKKDLRSTFADFLSWQLLTVLTKIDFFHGFWARLVYFCTSVDAEIAGQLKNAIMSSISDLYLIGSKKRQSIPKMASKLPHLSYFLS